MGIDGIKLIYMKYLAAVYLAGKINEKKKFIESRLIWKCDEKCPHKLKFGEWKKVQKWISSLSEVFPSSFCSLIAKLIFIYIHLNFSWPL